VLANLLHDELLAIPGIAGAELEGAVEHPAGVRVQLAVGADADMVGREVQRVLAAHGMRSQLTQDDETLLPPGSVVNLSDYEADAPVAAAAEPAATEAAVEVVEGPPPAMETSTVSHDSSGAEPEITAPQVAATQVEEQAPEPEPAAGLASVGVDEDESRVVVTARASDGRSAARAAPATPDGLDHAAALAGADLASPDATPLVIAFADASIEGTPVINVILEVAGGTRVVGAAVVRGSRAYAVAKAAWAALRP